MATTLKEGDRVQIIDRDATADDVKSGLFYNHFRNLTGTIQKIYETEEATVEVDDEALSEPVGQRHADVREQMKTRWLDGLSDEARNRLGEQEKDFHLRYTVLVNLKDVAPGKAREENRAKQEREAEETPVRKTLAEIEAAEQAHLESRRKDA